MTKTFEEELFNKVPCKFELTTEAEYKKSTLINHFKNWHSDEEFQELKEEYSNQADSILLMLEEIANLKSKLQQQALPVVKDFVAEWYEEHKDDLDFSIFEACVNLHDDCSSDFEKWFGNSENKSIETLVRMKDGYQVEKLQLFKLIFPNSTAVLQKDGELNSFADTVYKRYLIENAMTEQEIKSIDERYWQFAVPVEDGE